MQADAQGRATYLLTTDAYRFYETVGYKLVGEDWLGIDNPKWTGAPVPIRVVSTNLFVWSEFADIDFPTCRCRENHSS